MKRSPASPAAVAPASTVSAGADAGRLLEVTGMTVGVRRRGLGRGLRRPPVTPIVREASFAVAPGQVLGVVGESGCGKSTLARAVVQLQRPSAGRVVFDGQDLVPLGGRQLRAARRHLQMVFQDPHSSLDPRMHVEDLVAEPLQTYRLGDPRGRAARVRELLASVGLGGPEVLSRRPGQLSGGQAQRVAIARALASDPKLVVLDEAVSSLDVSVRAQVLNLLVTLAAERHLSYLFIAHDLAAVAYVSDVIAVMYLGRICEMGPARAIFGGTGHPYTELLVASDPREAARRGGLERASLDSGEVPAIHEVMGGCPYAGRCPEAEERCHHEAPVLRPVAPGHWVACHVRAAAASPPPDASGPRHP